MTTVDWAVAPALIVWERRRVRSFLRDVARRREVQVQVPDGNAITGTQSIESVARIQRVRYDEQADIHGALHVSRLCANLLRSTWVTR